MIFGISLASKWCVLFQCTTVGANTLVDEFTAILSLLAVVLVCSPCNTINLVGRISMARVPLQYK